MQILPNWCKKLGLTLFVIGSIIGGGDGFMGGLSGIPNNGSGIITMLVGGEPTIHIFNVVAIVSLLFYMISKEKIEDDYINLLRLESFQFTAIIGLILSILLFTFSKDIKLTLDYFIILFMWLYLFTFFIKKRNV